jgi:uncharacterized membrane protein YeaQ/YmgE (transglycosylase-associated protein family)
MTFELVVLGVLVGLLAGGLARFAVKAGGYGLAADLILGLIGSVSAGWIFRVLAISPGADFFALVVVGVVGATGSIIVQRRIWPTIA